MERTDPPLILSDSIGMVKSHTLNEGVVCPGRKEVTPLSVLIVDVQTKIDELKRAIETGDDKLIDDACNRLRIASENVATPQFFETMENETFKKFRMDSLKILKNALDAIPEQADPQFKQRIAECIHWIELLSLNDHGASFKSYMHDKLSTLFEQE